MFNIMDDTGYHYTSILDYCDRIPSSKIIPETTMTCSEAVYVVSTLGWGFILLALAGGGWTLSKIADVWDRRKERLRGGRSAI